MEHGNPFRPFPPGMRRIVLIAAASLAAVLLLLFLLPRLLRPMIEEELTALAGRPVRIPALAFNPLTLRVEIRGLRIEGEDGQDILAVERLGAALSPQALARRAVRLRSVEVATPLVRCVQRSNGTLEYDDLFPSAPEPEGTTPSAWSLEVRDLALTNGSFVFDDRQSGRTIRVEGVRVDVPEQSERPLLSVEMLGGRMAAELLSDPAAPEIRARLTVENLDLSACSDLIPPIPGYRPASGVLAADLEAAYRPDAPLPDGLGITGRAEVRSPALIPAGDAPAFSAESVAAEGLSFRQEQGLDLGQVSVARPKVRIAFPPSALDAGPAAKPSPPPSPAPALPFRVGSIAVQGGECRLEEPDGKALLALTGLDLKLGPLAGGLGRPTDLTLSAALQGSGKVSFSGRLAPWPLLAQGDVRLAGIDLAGQTAALKRLLGPSSPDRLGGVLDAACGLTLSLHGAVPELRLSAGSFNLKGAALRLAGQERDLLGLRSMSLSGAALDLRNRTASAERLLLESPLADLEADAQGRLFPGQGHPVPPAGHGRKDNPWRISLQEMALRNGTAFYADNRFPGPFRMNATEVNLSGSRLGTHGPGDFTFSAHLPHNATLQLEGVLFPTTPAAQVRVRLKGLDVRDFLALRPEGLALTPTRGAVQVKGDLRVEAGEDAPWKVRFQGQSELRRFAFAVNASATPLLLWKNLTLDGLEAETAPFRASARLLDLERAVATIRLSPDKDAPKTADPQAPADENRVAGDAPPAPRTAAPSAAPLWKQLRVEEIRFSNCDLAFRDSTIEPPVRVLLSGMEGRITNLFGENPAQVDIRSKVNDYGLLDVKGKARLFSDRLKLDLDLGLSNLQASQFEPYIRKYLGYRINRGQAGLRANLALDKTLLVSTNTIVLEDFHLGERVDSPEAIKVPLELALSLLRDSKGDVELNIPVEGDLDKPDFKVGGAVMSAIANTFWKIIKSPFAFFGLLFGGGGQTGYVAFAPGSADLDDMAVRQLDKLAASVAKRPRFSVELTGYAELPGDLEGIKASALRRAASRSRTRAQMTSGETDEHLWNAELSDEDYARQLPAVYESFRRRFPDLPARPEEPAAMERVLLQRIRPDERHVQAFARERAAAVRDRLVKEGGMDPSRIAVTDRPGAQAEPVRGVPATRVDVQLKY